VRVVVLGSGVIGVASAWYLARAGHEVVVLDRQPAAGMETSFANAGQVSPALSAPWAGPGMPLKVLKWLFMRHSPFVMRPQADWRLWRFLVDMAANCTEAAYAVNKSRMVRLAEYSRDCLRDLRAETGITYDDRQRGTLQLFRTQAQLDHSAEDIAVLKKLDVPYRLLDRAGCVAAEPALAQTQEKIVGGLQLPGDETGDAHKFTQALAKLAEAEGVRFRYGVPIVGLRTEGDAITGVETEIGIETGDAYVVAMGSYSPLLLQTIGIRLPVYPVKGYSLTVPIVDPESAPVSTVMDETFKVGITRLGDRIRVGGTAELAGWNLTLRAVRRRTLEHSVQDLFPRGGDLSRALFWTGLRPMTPDGTPVIGPTRFRNLHLNTGHGTLGWTMACGSGRLLADLLSGVKPNIQFDDLSIARYGAA